MFRSEAIRVYAVKVAVKLQTRQMSNIGGFQAPDFKGTKPIFGHEFLNRIHFRKCDRFSLSSVYWARIVTKKIKKKKIN